MQILELPLRIHIQSEAEKRPEKSTVGMAYLRSGITWIPEYTLKVIDDETAELSLRGTLVNEAEDLVQETFVRALRSWGGFDGRSKPSTWLYTIAREWDNPWPDRGFPIEHRTRGRTSSAPFAQPR